MENEIQFIVVVNYSGRIGLSFGVRDNDTGLYVMQDGAAFSVEEIQATGCTVFGLSIVPLP